MEVKAINNRFGHVVILEGGAEMDDDLLSLFDRLQSLGVQVSVIKSVYDNPMTTLDFLVSNKIKSILLHTTGTMVDNIQNIVAVMDAIGYKPENVLMTVDSPLIMGMCNQRDIDYYDLLDWFDFIHRDDLLEIDIVKSN